MAERTNKRSHNFHVCEDEEEESPQSKKDANSCRNNLMAKVSTGTSKWAWKLKVQVMTIITTRNKIFLFSREQQLVLILGTNSDTWRRGFWPLIPLQSKASCRKAQWCFHRWLKTWGTKRFRSWWQWSLENYLSQTMLPRCSREWLLLCYITIYWTYEINFS